MAAQGNVRVPSLACVEGALEKPLLCAPISQLLLSSACYACYLFLASFLGYLNLILRFQDSYSRNADF